MFIGIIRRIYGFNHVLENLANIIIILGIGLFIFPIFNVYNTAIKNHTIMKSKLVMQINQ